MEEGTTTIPSISPEEDTKIQETPESGGCDRVFFPGSRNAILNLVWI